MAEKKEHTKEKHDHKKHTPEAHRKHHVKTHEKHHTHEVRHAHKDERHETRERRVHERVEHKEEPKTSQKPRKSVVFTIGKRKRAVARAVVKPGKGIIKINSLPIDSYKDDLFRMRVQEPFILIGPDWKGYDFSVNVKGGGKMGQADAVRQSLARGLVQIFGDGVKAKYLEYDRSLLVYDPRRTEPHKPPRSSQGPRRYKQRSKR
jgi:small subunit ribosomal protein S9